MCIINALCVLPLTRFVYLISGFSLIYLFLFLGLSLSLARPRPEQKEKTTTWYQYARYRTRFLVIPISAMSSKE